MQGINSNSQYENKLSIFAFLHAKPLYKSTSVAAGPDLEHLITIYIVRPPISRTADKHCKPAITTISSIWVWLIKNFGFAQALYTPLPSARFHISYCWGFKPLLHQFVRKSIIGLVGRVVHFFSVVHLWISSSPRYNYGLGVVENMTSQLTFLDQKRYN